MARAATKPTATSGMFTNAPKAPSTEAPAKTTGEKRKVAVENLLTTVRIDAAIKALTAAKTALRPAIEEFLAEKVFEFGVQDRGQPDNFLASETELVMVEKVVDGKKVKIQETAEAGAQIIITKRSTASPLKPEEVEAANRLKIRTGENLVGAKVDTFIINPVYMADMTMLARVATKLGGEPWFPGENNPQPFFLKQDGEPGVMKTVVTDESLVDLFAAGINDPDAFRDAFNLVAGFQIKPNKLNVGKTREPMAITWEGLKTYLTPAEDEEITE